MQAKKSEPRAFRAVVPSDAPVSVQQRFGQTLRAGLMEPLTAAAALQHLQVPPAAGHQKHQENFQTHE